MMLKSDGLWLDMCVSISHAVSMETYTVEPGYNDIG
jgi:hypothetical protein